MERVDGARSLTLRVRRRRRLAELSAILLAYVLIVVTTILVHVLARLGALA
jgi:hypothetical protein